MEELTTYNDADFKVLQGRLSLGMYGSDVSQEVAQHVADESHKRNQLKTESITAIHPDSWPTWSFVKTDHCTYKDNGWNGCDYRVESKSWMTHDHHSNGLAINVHITGKTSKWNGVTFETRARIEFVGDGEPSTFTKGKVYSTSDLTP